MYGKIAVTQLCDTRVWRFSLPCRRD